MWVTVKRWDQGIGSFYTLIRPYTGYFFQIQIYIFKGDADKQCQKLRESRAVKGHVSYVMNCRYFTSREGTSPLSSDYIRRTPVFLEDDIWSLSPQWAQLDVRDNGWLDSGCACHIHESLRLCRWLIVRQATLGGGEGLIKWGAHARPDGHLTRMLKGWDENGLHFMCQSNPLAVGT